MSRLEDRLRRDLRAQAEHITPLSVPPLRLQRFTRDPRAPAVTRWVTRRLPLRSAAVAAAALAASAVALSVAGVPGAPHDSTAGSAVNTAFVVERVNSALSAAEPGQIAQMTVTTRDALVPGGLITSEVWSYGSQWRLVMYSTAGHLVYDMGFSTASVHTLVSFLTRTWARGPGPGLPETLEAGLSGCGKALPATVARALRAVVSCGTLAEAGRQRVDGIEATKLTSPADSKISETIWVNPDTYLPVRVDIHPAPGSSAPWQEADISWLPPTPQNLTKLTVPIPAGFRQVPLPSQLIAPGPKAGRILPKTG